jgi:hypothetical protein
MIEIIIVEWNEGMPVGSNPEKSCGGISCDLKRCLNIGLHEIRNTMRKSPSAIGTVVKFGTKDFIRLCHHSGGLALTFHHAG